MKAPSPWSRTVMPMIESTAAGMAARSSVLSTALGALARSFWALLPLRLKKTIKEYGAFVCELRHHSPVLLIQCHILKSTQSQITELIVWGMRLLALYRDTQSLSAHRRRLAEQFSRSEWFRRSSFCCCSVLSRCIVEQLIF